MRYSEYEKKAERRKKLILGGIIVFVMVISTIGFALNNSGSTTASNVDYNGFKFHRVNNGWVTTISNTKFLFGYLPNELENVSMPNYILPDKIYLVNEQDDINTENALRRVGSILQYKGVNIQRACFDIKCGLDVPLLRCSDQKSIIYFKQGNSTAISQDGSCIIVESENNENLDRATERVIYFLLGVI